MKRRCDSCGTQTPLLDLDGLCPDCGRMNLWRSIKAEAPIGFLFAFAFLSIFALWWIS